MQETRNYYSHEPFLGKLQENKFSHWEDNAHWIYLTVKLKVYGDTSEYKYYVL